MSMHIRRVIMEDLRTQLKDIPLFSGIARIQRIGPPANALFPCVTLYAESESVDTVSIHGQARPQDRRLSVVVNAWIRGTQDDEKAESDMDSAALAIEQALLWPSNASDFALIGSDFEVSEDEPEIHVVRLTYQIYYSTTELNPAI